MFIVATFHVKTDTSSNTTVDSEVLARELQCFNWLKWGHLASALLQLLAMQLKSMRKHFIAKMLQMFVLVTYTLPMVRQQYLTKIASKDPVTFMTTDVRKYFFLEENLFIAQIMVGVIFMAFAYQFRVHSLWNGARPDFQVRGRGDKMVFFERVWLSKNRADFLHYLKFEFMQQGLFGSYLVVCVMLLTHWNLRDVHISTVNNYDTYPKTMNAIFYLALVHAIQVVLFQLTIYMKQKSLIASLAKKGETPSTSIHTKVQFLLLFAMFVFYVVATV